MSFFEKIQFWKKHDEFGPGMDQHIDLPEVDRPYGDNSAWQPPPPPQSFQSMPPPPSFNTPTPQYQNTPANRDFEIIESKLDTIKSQLDNLNVRLANIERMAKE